MADGANENNYVDSKYDLMQKGTCFLFTSVMNEYSHLQQTEQVISRRAHNKYSLPPQHPVKASKLLRLTFPQLN